MSVNIPLLRESWILVADRSERLASEFYGMLFSRYPQVRQLFPVVMDVQRDRLVNALTYVVLNLDDLDTVTAYLRELARDHRKFDVRPEHFTAVGRCLLAALRANAVDGWKPEYDEAWAEAYELIASVMIQAAAEDEVTSPPYWGGRVVGHRQRTPEIAVITVEPDQPYPYFAGQYTTIQTARWPKIWRAYSIANAPRPDNLLTFHVRVVPGGWVSTTLAHHTNIGDQVLLGPPRGSLTLPTPRPDRLLCLAGGTGLGPIKAVIEETLRSTPTPEITLVHAVRQERDLYDEDDLTRMSLAPGRLSVLTALSDDPDHLPRRTITDVIGPGDVADSPATYVCGPPEMVLATLDHLATLGLSPHLIRSEPDAGGMTQRLRVHAPT